jgi:hypothetical protein
MMLVFDMQGSESASSSGTRHQRASSHTTVLFHLAQITSLISKLKSGLAMPLYDRATGAFRLCVKHVYTCSLACIARSVLGTRMTSGISQQSCCCGLHIQTRDASCWSTCLSKNSLAYQLQVPVCITPSTLGLAATPQARVLIEITAIL